MISGTGDGAGPSSSDYASTSNPSQIIDETNPTVDWISYLDLESNQEIFEMHTNSLPSLQRQCDEHFFGAERSHGAAMPSNLEHPQHSLMIPVPTVNPPFALTKSYQPNGEGLRQGKESDDNGKDHEGAGNNFPGLTHRAYSVANTDKDPPDALPTGSEIIPGDPFPEKQQPIYVLGDKRPAQSLYQVLRQFPGEQPYDNQVQSFEASRPTHDTRAAYNPLDSGGPHDNGNHVAATTGIEEPARYNQHSSPVQKISMVEPSARKHKPFTFHESYDEGSSQGKQPQHNGKDHEVAGSGRPGPGISHTVGKTCTKPVRRTPEKSARRGGIKQCGHIDADKAARIRGSNWTVVESLYLLFKKQEFTETPGESWSVRASEFLKSEGFRRTSVSCQQRWDTMKKHYDKRDQFRIDEGYVPAGFYDQSLLYDLMRKIMEGHGEQQSPSKDTQGSGQLEGALAPSSAIPTDPIEFSNANGPSLPPDASIDDGYASGQVDTNPRIEFPNAIGLSLPPGVPTNDAYASGQTPTFKDLASNPSMQTRTGVHQKQQSLQNDTSRGGQMVDASAQLSQGTQEPKVSSHDPHLIEMVRRIVHPLFQEMEEKLEEKMKISQDESMAAISAVQQEVKIMLETCMNGKN